MFVIREGIHSIPELGKRIDTRTKLSNDALLELCFCKSFSTFISINKKAVPFLKKQKLTEKQVVSLINKSNTVAEVELLLEVKTTKIISKFAETKINTLESL